MEPFKYTVIYPVNETNSFLLRTILPPIRENDPSLCLGQFQFNHR